MEKPKIVCLCGSTRFFKLFDEMNFHFTLSGKIVLNIGCNTKCDNDLFSNMSKPELAKCMKILNELHLRKIDIADEIFVINKNGYIGESTRNEINYAVKLGKPISYLESLK